jgi:hypothetical protein
MPDQISTRPLRPPRDDFNDSAPAPGGWTSFLTWRTTQPEPVRPARQMRTPSPTLTPLPHSSPTATPYRGPTRSRAPIPFDIGPRRTPSSGSISSISRSHQRNKSSSSSSSRLHQRGNSSSSSAALSELEDYDDESDQFHAVGSAFANLARVIEKDDGFQNTVRTTRDASSSTTQRPSRYSAKETLSDESKPTEGWLAWGTSRIRSTLPRNMASALFYAEESSKSFSDEHSSLNDSSSPAKSASTTSSKPHENYGFTDDNVIDRCVDRMVGFAGVDEDSRSIVTLSAPSLPPWDQVSHDAILQRILTKTLPLVENPGGYTLILFASGSDSIDGSHASKTLWPGWTWCWKAWRSLGRRWV